jgi:hypothetical protein
LILAHRFQRLALLLEVFGECVMLRGRAGVIIGGRFAQCGGLFGESLLRALQCCGRAVSAGARGIGYASDGEVWLVKELRLR